MCGDPFISYCLIYYPVQVNVWPPLYLLLINLLPVQVNVWKPLYLLLLNLLPRAGECVASIAVRAVWCVRHRGWSGELLAARDPQSAHV